MRKVWSILSPLAVLAADCQNAEANPVLDWNFALIEAAKRDTSPPVLVARNLALMHFVIEQALADAQPLDEKGRAMLSGAACSAADALYPSHHASFERLCARHVAASERPEVWPAALKVGRQKAEPLIASRSCDGIATNLAYVPSNASGRWRRTGPALRPPELTHWGKSVKPFALVTAEQFRPPGPPALTSATYADHLNELKVMGDRESKLRTVEQTLIARFWSDFSYTETPVGHWNSIARSIAEKRNLSVQESARLFALLNVTLADTGIAVWEAKYHFDSWRPVTAIQRGDEDGNPATAPDITWQSLLPSPPHPDYVSGHSAFSGAAATLLAHFFGTDAITFTARSDTLKATERRFTSLKACAIECGESRIYAGIHFRFACEDGFALGQRVADFVWQNRSRVKTTKSPQERAAVGTVYPNLSYPVKQE